MPCCQTVRAVAPTDLACSTGPRAARHGAQSAPSADVFGSRHPHDGWLMSATEWTEVDMSELSDRNGDVTARRRRGLDPVVGDAARGDDGRASRCLNRTLATSIADAQWRASGRAGRGRQFRRRVRARQRRGRVRAGICSGRRWRRSGCASACTPAKCSCATRATTSGPTINRTARLRDLAHGGQTVLSGATEDTRRSTSCPPTRR